MGAGPVEDRGARLGSGNKVGFVHELGLQGGEEALGHGSGDPEHPRDRRAQVKPLQPRQCAVLHFIRHMRSPLQPQSFFFGAAPGAAAVAAPVATPVGCLTADCAGG
jgi:hypothetical protein